MFQTSVLMSGSKGNCFLVKYKSTQIIIDAGITYKKYCLYLNQLKLDTKKLDAIFISHEHIDHISGAGVLHRKTEAPLYLTKATFTYSKKMLNELLSPPVLFKIGDYIHINDLIIHPFISPHDAIDSCNFFIYPKDNNSKKLIIATDLGHPHKLLKNYLSQSTTIILESNHDTTMLLKGPYDWYLKQRILSKNGHLSNEQAKDLIEDILNDKHDRLILTHLSEINNTPEIAYNCMKEMLNKNNSMIDLQVASQSECTQLFDI